MIDERSTLEDVCFDVAHALEARGMPATLTGGAAAALYARGAYTSHDADFILERDDPLSDVEAALRTIGFTRTRRSRLFVHRQTIFTVDFPRGPLAAGREYVTNTNVLERGGKHLRILRRIDCVRDRLAHYLHWNDFTALDAAVAVAAAAPEHIDLADLRAWAISEFAESREKFAEFEARLRRST